MNTLINDNSLIRFRLGNYNSVGVLEYFYPSFLSYSFATSGMAVGRFHCKSLSHRGKEESKAVSCIQCGMCPEVVAAITQGVRIRGMRNFILHETLAREVLNVSFSSGVGSWEAWQSPLTNTNDPTLAPIGLICSSIVYQPHVLFWFILQDLRFSGFALSSTLGRPCCSLSSCALIGTGPQSRNLGMQGMQSICMPCAGPSFTIWICSKLFFQAVTSRRRQILA